LMAQRQEFAQLIAKGVSNSEACRLVGVNRRTGTRWRFGRTVTFKSGAEQHYPPMATKKATCLSARFLSEDERVMIADRVRAGVSLRAIGRELTKRGMTVESSVSERGIFTVYERDRKSEWCDGDSDLAIC
jgi:transposase, IS30 family